MAAKSATFDNDFLKLIFNATTMTGMARNDTSPVTDLYVSLHTASPGTSGNQTTNEIAYGGYARQPVVRTSSGWTVTANSVSPAAQIDFPIGISGSGTATYFAVGTDITGTGKVLYFGTVTPNIVCGTGVTPSLTTATAITEA